MNIVRRNNYRVRTLNSRVGWGGAQGLLRQAGYQGGQVSDVLLAPGGRTQRAWFEPQHPSQMANGRLTLISDADDRPVLGVVRKPVDAVGRLIDDGSIEGYQGVHQALRELGITSANLRVLPVPTADGTRVQVTGGFTPIDQRLRQVLGLQPGLSTRTFQTMPEHHAANLGSEGMKVDLTSFAADRDGGGMDDVSRLLTSWGVPGGAVRRAFEPGMGTVNIDRFDIGGGKLLSVENWVDDPDAYINYIVHRLPGPLENGVVAREVKLVDTR